MSQQSIEILSLPVKATAALTSRRFVTVAGAVPAAGANALGVARSDGATGETVAVDVLGTAVVEAGGAISAGAAVEVDASGRAVTQSTGVTVGRALEAAAAAGDFIEVLLIPN